MEIIEGRLYFIKDEFIEKYNPKYKLMEKDLCFEVIQTCPNKC